MSSPILQMNSMSLCCHSQLLNRVYRLSSTLTLFKQHQMILYQMTAIAEMVSYYGWADVVAVFNDDDQSRNSIITLGDKLAERRCKISYKAVLPPAPAVTQSQITSELVKIQLTESRVIVLNTVSEAGLMIFDIGKRLGMLQDGYIWIATTWLSLDSNSPLHSDTASSIQGALTLRPHTPDSKRKRYFMERWSKLSNGSIGFNPYGLYAYDTVWLIARAIKLLLDQGQTISFSNDTKLSNLGQGTINFAALSIFDGGQELLHKILQTNMTGLTGPIQFNSDRSLINPSYDIINVLETGYKQIGYWSIHSGLYEKPPNRSTSNKHLYSVVWPGGVTRKPRGWVFRRNGKQLRIGVPDRVSYRDFVSRANGTNIIRGYCIDIFLSAIRLLEYAAPYEFIPFGDGHKNPNYYELVNGLTSEVFDAVIGDIAIVTDRTKIVDFTQPYIESGLVVVARVRKLNSNA
ncbi:glutamate receptor 3.2-like [Carica papaya]|uniref:glutamate receptor 3.2-like n=1 Tax=Carica papaya TaxID=3649 RepID=UPI000B8CC76F|nr:glutamate receptor 3.2-like [Carica papaya]